ncbi:MAG: hypothetical protein AAGK01_00040 [Pseudomonadota bacterium]
MLRFGLVGVAALLVSACAGGSSTTSTRSASSTPRPTVSTTPSPEAFRPPRVMRERGLDGVIGAGAASLTARFGAARIDLAEGDARKLQFASKRCVLNVFLYPLEAGSEPVATHVDARLRAGGAETDRSRCISEIERR